MSSITHGASSPDGDEGGGARRGRGWRRGRDRDPDPTAETPEDVVGLDEDEVESLILRSIAAGREDAVDGDVDAAPAADEDIASKVSARSRQDHEPALTVGNTRPSPPAASEASSDEDVEIDWSAVVSPVERPRSVEPEEDVEAVASEAEPETAPLGGTYDEPMDVRAELLGTRDPIAAAEPAASVDAPVGEASRDDEAARRVIAQALEAGFSEPVPTEPKRRLFGRRRNRKDDPDEDDELLADEELAAGDETGADEVPETEAAGGPTDVEAAEPVELVAAPEGVERSASAYDAQPMAGYADAYDTAGEELDLARAEHLATVAAQLRRDAEMAAAEQAAERIAAEEAAERAARAREEADRLAQEQLELAAQASQARAEAEALAERAARARVEAEQRALEAQVAATAARDSAAAMAAENQAVQAQLAELQSQLIAAQQQAVEAAQARAVSEEVAARHAAARAEAEAAAASLAQQLADAGHATPAVSAIPVDAGAVAEPDTTDRGADLQADDPAATSETTETDAVADDWAADVEIEAATAPETVEADVPTSVEADALLAETAAAAESDQETDDWAAQTGLATAAGAAAAAAAARAGSSRWPPTEAPEAVESDVPTSVEADALLAESHATADTGEDLLDRWAASEAAPETVETPLEPTQSGSESVLDRWAALSAARDAVDDEVETEPASDLDLETESDEEAVSEEPPADTGSLLDRWAALSSAREAEAAQPEPTTDDEIAADAAYDLEDAGPEEDLTEEPVGTSGDELLERWAGSWPGASKYDDRAAQQQDAAPDPADEAEPVEVAEPVEMTDEAPSAPETVPVDVDEAAEPEVEDRWAPGGNATGDVDEDPGADEATDADHPADVDDPVAEEPAAVSDDPDDDDLAGQLAAAAATTHQPYKSKRGSSALSVFALLAAIACAAVVVRMAILDTLRDDIPLAGTLTGVTVVLLAYALRANNQSRSVHLDETGMLRLVYGENHHTFDLTSPSTTLELVGTPGQRGWQMRILRRNMSPVVVDSKTVESRTFTEAVRQWRPDL